MIAVKSTSGLETGTTVTKNSKELQRDWKFSIIWKSNVLDKMIPVCDHGHSS